MRVLVTGGAGYIGCHGARALKRRGHEVVIYDNFNTGHRELAKGFELIEGDVGDAFTLARALRDIDAVMHFAAHSLVGESVQNPRKYFENNVCDGLVLLNTCLEAGVHKFIFSSSAAVYGNPREVPIAEDAPKQPVNPYGFSKLSFEYAMQSYDPAYGLRFVSLRYFNAAGCDESGEIGELHHPETHLIPAALQSATGARNQLQIFGEDYDTPDGTCIRDYIHVDDLAEAHVLALEHLAAGGASNILNLGTGKGHTVKEVITTIECVIERELPKRIVGRRPGDPPVLLADPSRAEKLLGWKATRSLEQMVASAWKFHQLYAQRTRAVSEN
ncbi:MAG: UDP-glucose 4-epimerase GalE [Acidobacteriia bacterium]|nr:UDP-glucose 4-epimerase GalE [Terriglobia bacterium]